MSASYSTFLIFITLTHSLYKSTLLYSTDRLKYCYILSHAHSDSGSNCHTAPIHTYCALSRLSLLHMYPPIHFSTLLYLSLPFSCTTPALLMVLH